MHTDENAYDRLQRKMNPSPIRVISDERPFIFISITPENPIRLPIMSFMHIFSSLKTAPVMNMHRKTPELFITEAFVPDVWASPI